MAALIAETEEKITTETGGVFLGRYRSGIWYVMETIDPGPGAVCETAYFEYDQAYVSHLANKISRLYRNQLELLGLWHRHTGLQNSFSKTDDGTNERYARQTGYGAISGLVNLTPEFGLTMYHVSLPLAYQNIGYTVNDACIPTEIGELRSEKINTIDVRH